MAVKPPQPRFRPLQSQPGYEVSRTGRIRRIGYKHEFSHHVDPNGRLLTTISNDNGPFCLAVARAVGEAWCEDYTPEKRPIFADGDKTHCTPGNMRWVSVSDYYKIVLSNKKKSS